MDFYHVDEMYSKFLQDYEKEHRGVTKVPNIRYADRDKFVFGTVLSVNGFNYYVSVSSFDKKQEANILIRITGDKKEIKYIRWLFKTQNQILQITVVILKFLKKHIANT